jgi:hypothetical protein
MNKNGLKFSLLEFHGCCPFIRWMKTTLIEYPLYLLYILFFGCFLFKRMKGPFKKKFKNIPCVEMAKVFTYYGIIFNFKKKKKNL